MTTTIKTRNHFNGTQAQELNIGFNLNTKQMKARLADYEVKSVLVPKVKAEYDLKIHDVSSAITTLEVIMSVGSKVVPADPEQVKNLETLKALKDKLETEKAQAIKDTPKFEYKTDADVALRKVYNKAHTEQELRDALKAWFEGFGCTNVSVNAPIITYALYHLGFATEQAKSDAMYVKERLSGKDNSHMKDTGFNSCLKALYAKLTDYAMEKGMINPAVIPEECKALFEIEQAEAKAKAEARKQAKAEQKVKAEVKAEQKTDAEHAPQTAQ